MTNKLVEIFDGMTVAQVEDFLKNVAKDYVKDRKATEKEALVASVKADLP